MQARLTPPLSSLLLAPGNQELIKLAGLCVDRRFPFLASTPTLQYCMALFLLSSETLEIGQEPLGKMDTTFAGAFQTSSGHKAS